MTRATPRLRPIVKYSQAETHCTMRGRGVFP